MPNYVENLVTLKSKYAKSSVQYATLHCHDSLLLMVLTGILVSTTGLDIIFSVKLSVDYPKTNSTTFY